MIYRNIYIDKKMIKNLNHMSVRVHVIYYIAALFHPSCDFFFYLKFAKQKLKMFAIHNRDRPAQPSDRITLA